MLVQVPATQLESGRCQDDEGDGDEPEETPPEKTCFQTLFGLTTDTIPILPRCLFGPNVINLRLTNIFQALPRIYCVIKCVFAELTVFTPEGRLDEVAALLFFQEAFPEYALPPLIEQAQPCLGLADGFKPQQYFCQSYAPMIQCLANTLVTGIGPFALECLGIPFFKALFGVLNFVVPQERPEPGEQARRRRLQTEIKGTFSNNSSFLARIKERREQVREKEAQRLLKGLPTLTPQIESVQPTTLVTTSSPPSTTALPPPSPFSSTTYVSSNNRWDGNANSYAYSSDLNRAQQDLRMDFLWNRKNPGYGPQYHTNNTETVVYQMDRMTNLARSLQMLLNNTGRSYYQR